MLVDDLPLDRSQLARIAGCRFSAVTYLAETTSTNTVLAAEARAGAAEGAVVVADHQSAGRGRLDRTWEAPPGTGLLMSVLLRPPQTELPGDRRHLAVAALALAVSTACSELAGTVTWLKWPNDVMAPGCGARAPSTSALAGRRAPLRKLAGVLAEVADTDALVVGAGINVSWSPPHLAATNLEELAGEPVSRGELLVRALLELDRLYGDWGTVSRLYAEHCATVGCRARVDLGAGKPPLVGVAEGVAADGALLVRDNQGRLTRVVAGDVVHAALT